MERPRGSISNILLFFFDKPKWTFGGSGMRVLLELPLCGCHKSGAKPEFLNHVSPGPTIWCQFYQHSETNHTDSEPKKKGERIN
jgi:hypothetical protein